MSNKKPAVKTATLLPSKGTFGLIADFAVLSTLILASITMLLMSLRIVEQITITVGK
jgi:hypothetical protein